MYDGPSNSSIYLSINDYTFAYSYSKFNGSFKILKNTDYKIILNAEITPILTFPISTDLGRILLRNDQTLMKEGIPFSAQNKCLYFNEVFSIFDLTNNTLRKKISKSEFCCQEFENEFITASTTVTNVTSSASTTITSSQSTNSDTTSVNFSTTTTSNSLRNNFSNAFIIFSCVELLLF